MDIEKISKIVIALGTVAVLSMDLGLEYNPLETKIYTHPLFQLTIVLASAYEITQEVSSTFVVLAIWLSLKGMIFKF